MTTTTIEDLSPELLVKIFSHYVETKGCVRFASNVARVCKTWRNLSSTPSLWKSIKLKNWRWLMTLSERNLLGPTQSIKLSSCRYPYDDDGVEISLEHNCLQAALSRIHELKSLTIFEKHIHEDTMKIVAEHCPNLEYLSLTAVFFDKHRPITLENLNPLLRTCGPKLKHLTFTNCDIKDGKKVIAEIIDRCPSLEVLVCNSVCSKFPIYKLANGCPQLRKLELWACKLDTVGGKNCPGFKNLTLFKAAFCNFKGLDLCSLLTNSSDLDHLELVMNEGLIFHNVTQISSDKVRFLHLSLELEGAVNAEALEKAMDKWKYTLLRLEIYNCPYNITKALEIFLDGNPYPKLVVLYIDSKQTSQSFYEMFVEKCQNLREFNRARIPKGVPKKL